MEHRRRSLILYAYNILGSYEEAKDIVQDVFLKYSQLGKEDIANENAYLIRMVVNLAIDRKRKLKKIQSENYPGHWLPEPLVTEDPHSALYRKEILSYSLLVLLEKLDSKQRAVFILKEAFDYDHEEIGNVLDITPANSRKILSRAKVELQNQDAKSYVGQMDVMKQYLAVLEQGDMPALEALLHQEVVITSDGGGKAPASRNRITGIKSVGAFLSGLYRKRYHDVRHNVVWINHQPAILYYVDDVLVTCQILDTQEERIQNIFFVRNPDKLKIVEEPALFAEP